MKILVVDDMMTMRHVMMSMLRSIGFTDLDEAADGVRALTLLKKNKYDLVITDFYMPNLDGKELLEKIRSQKETQNIPVVMVTCVDSKEKVESIIASKVTGFIIKPFTANTLKKQMERIEALIDTSKFVA